jgi:hypothetical protein
MLPLEGENRDEEDDEEARRGAGQELDARDGDDCRPHRDFKCAEI